MYEVYFENWMGMDEDAYYTFETAEEVAEFAMVEYNRLTSEENWVIKHDGELKSYIDYLPEDF